MTELFGIVAKVKGLLLPKPIKALNYLRDSRLYSADRWKIFKERCFTPKVFYEIGANNPFSSEGQQTSLKTLMPNTRFFLFEAAEKHEPALERSGEPYVIVLLGEADGLAKTFYETTAYSAGDGDSYYRENSASYADNVIKPKSMMTRSLDSIVAEREWPLPDFIKIDVQGAEIDVLRGASKCLATARGLQIECAVNEYNQGAPLVPEVISFVGKEGFRVYDICQMHFDANSELLQVDLMFIRG